MGKREIIIAWRLCCYYTDGKNTCDPQVTRAAAAEFSGRYCVLYLKEQKADKSGCSRRLM
jgi:hypothetical protein